MSTFLDHLTKRWLWQLHLLVDASVALLITMAALCSPYRAAVIATVVGATVVAVGALLRADKQVRRMLADAYTDPLTGLATRAVAEHLLARIDATGEITTVAFADADGLKRVNDVHGHPVGDRYLFAVARRLRRAVGEYGSVVRLGGDEFAVFTTMSPEDLAEAVDTAMASARMSEYGLWPNVSVGIDVTGSGSAADALMRADAAMHTAKFRGGRTLIYNADRDGTPGPVVGTPWMRSRTSAGSLPRPSAYPAVGMVSLTVPQAMTVHRALHLAAEIASLSHNDGGVPAARSGDVAIPAGPDTGAAASAGVEYWDLAHHVATLINRTEP